jgi:glutathione S-transferase
MTYSHWQEPANWPIIKEAFFQDLPLFLKSIVPPIARRATSKNLYGHGMGRHSAAEIYSIGNTDLLALADFLAAKPFFMGDRPTSLDASAYGLLANILWVPLPSPLQDTARQLTNLNSFCERLRDRYYPTTTN